jgi:pyruvate/2-oxoglutarate dehydrogenase complex dihydrolipoamide acyltransferase (E2) component
MKFLEAKDMAKDPENKMRRGSRPDQKEFIPKGQLHPDNPVSPKQEVVEYARSLGVDIRKIKGSGRNGEIMMKDVKDAKDDQDK